MSCQIILGKSWVSFFWSGAVSRSLHQSVCTGGCWVVTSRGGRGRGGRGFSGRTWSPGAIWSHSRVWPTHGSASGQPSPPIVSQWTTGSTPYSAERRRQQQLRLPENRRHRQLLCRLLALGACSGLTQRSRIRQRRRLQPGRVATSGPICSDQIRTLHMDLGLTRSEWGLRQQLCRTRPRRLGNPHRRQGTSRLCLGQEVYRVKIIPWSRWLGKSEDP